MLGHILKHISRKIIFKRVVYWTFAHYFIWINCRLLNTMSQRCFYDVSGFFDLTFRRDRLWVFPKYVLLTIFMCPCVSDSCSWCFLHMQSFKVTFLSFPYQILVVAWDSDWIWGRIHTYFLLSLYVSWEISSQSFKQRWDKISLSHCGWAADRWIDNTHAVYLFALSQILSTQLYRSRIPIVVIVLGEMCSTYAEQSECLGYMQTQTRNKLKA